MFGNVFDIGGPMSLGTDYYDPYGGNGVSLGEAADAANGPWDYNNAGMGVTGWRDAAEQARMQAGYPNNGASWDINAALTGVSRLIDSGARAYATANGMMPMTYAGQNGLTYVAGRNGVAIGGGMLLPLLLVAGVALIVLAK